MRTPLSPAFKTFTRTEGGGYEWEYQDGAKYRTNSDYEGLWVWGGDVFMPSLKVWTQVKGTMQFSLNPASYQRAEAEALFRQHVYSNDFDYQMWLEKTGRRDSGASMLEYSRLTK